MPDFKFTSPDGKQYTVKGPDGSTKEQAFQILQGQLAAPGNQPDPQMAGVPGYDAQGRKQAPAAAPVKAERPVNGVDVLMGGKGTAGDVFDKVLGTVEAPVSMATGMIGGLAGAVAGLGKAAGKKLLTGQGSSDKDIDSTVSSVANALTYQPRTATGANLAQMAGTAIQDSGVAGLALPELNAAAQATGNAARAVRGAAAATAATQNAADAAAAAGAKGSSLRDLVRAPKQLSGVGAAEASAAAQRAERAASMPVPMKLTKGMLTRDFDQVQFERETAKAKEGKPLLDRYGELNQQMGQNLDAFAEQTGGEAASLRSTGKSAVDAVGMKKSAAKKQVRSLYEEAERSGEMQEPVDVTALVDYLAKNKGKDKLAPIISTIEGELKQNAKVEGGGYDSLTLAQRPTRTVMTLGASEDLRQAINKLAQPGTPNIVYGKEAKAIIDAATEGKGGEKYQQARRAYENYANEFVNRDVIDKLLRDKPGTKDRAVAYEDVMKHTLLNGSRDDVQHVFRVLEAHPEGTDPAIVAAGQQAAKDLRGAMVNHIKEQVFSNAGADSMGNPVGSAAKFNRLINELDKDGKLEPIFGKKGAAQLRDARDLATDIYTSPAGSVNSSNTASALIKALDTAAGYTQGVPVIGKAVRFGVQQVKSKQTMNKVKQALEPNLSDLSGKGK